MDEILAFIQQNKNGSLATCSGSKADVRPFELVYHGDKGVFFYTSENADLYEQLKANPAVCFCATDQNNNYVKISGSALFSDDEKDKAKILEKSQFAKKIFADPTAKNMKVFYLPHAAGSLHYYADNKAVEGRL